MARNAAGNLKIGVLIRCYHATEYLARVLKNYSWVDKIFIMNYRFTSVAPISDDTEEIAKQFPNVEVEKGENVIQHEIFNRGLDKLKDYDYVFISDADEFILPEEQKKMIVELHKTGKDYGFCMVKDYFHDPYHCFPQRQGHFIAITKPKAARFTHIRQLSHNAAKRQDFPYLIHHFGFALQSDHLKWKMKWESVEEGVDVEKNVANMPSLDCTPPAELLEILK